jgi:hypothetical protein
MPYKSPLSFSFTFEVSQAIKCLCPLSLSFTFEAVKAKNDGGNGPLYKIAPDGADPDMVATQKSIAIAEPLY